MNTYPQREKATIFFFWLVGFIFFFKLSIANVKMAIITVLQLHKKHNLANNTSAYMQPWFAATVSHCCYFRSCRGFPGAVELEARHAEPYHRQGESTPQPPGAKLDATKHTTTGHLIPGSGQPPSRDMSPGKGTQKGLQEREEMMLRMRHFLKACE